MLRPVISGAEPWVACAIACFSPTHSPGARPEPADEARADVGQDVAELVGRHHHVEPLRLHDELHRESEFDHHLLECHVRIVARDLAAFLREHAASEPIDRLLVRGGDLLARTGAGDLERLARDPVRALAGDHAHRDRDVVVRPELRQAGDHRLGIEHALGQFGVGNYAIKPTFSDGHESGLFSWDYLYFLGHEQERLWQEYFERLAAAGVDRDAPMPTSSGGACGHHH